jgi:hypothetical protein
LEDLWYHKCVITICSIKRKENFFSLLFFRVRKRAVLSLVPPPLHPALVIKQLFLAREQKNSRKKFFLFIEHAVLFYETPFLHHVRQTMSVPSPSPSPGRELRGSVGREKEKERRRKPSKFIRRSAYCSPSSAPARPC